MGDDDYKITINASEDIGGWDSSITINDITYSMPDQNSNTVTLDSSFINDTGTEFTYNMPNFDQTEFVDVMPSVSHIEEMCDEYPALAKVYEQFKLIYKMTEQDYKGKLKERNI